MARWLLSTCCFLLSTLSLAAGGPSIRSTERDSIRLNSLQGTIPRLALQPLKDIPLSGCPLSITMDVASIAALERDVPLLVYEALITVELPANVTLLNVQPHEGYMTQRYGLAQPKFSDVYTVTVQTSRDAVTQTLNFAALTHPRWKLMPGFVLDVRWPTTKVYPASEAPFAQAASRIHAMTERGDYTITMDVLEPRAAKPKNIAVRADLTVTLPPGAEVISVIRHEGHDCSRLTRANMYSVTLRLDGVARTHLFDFTELVAGDWMLGPTSIERIFWRTPR